MSEGLTPEKLVSWAGLGLLAFLAQDAISARDEAPINVERDVREVLALTLAPMVDDISDLQNGFDRFIQEQRQAQREFQQRLSTVENRESVWVSRFTLLEERVERIGVILRNAVNLEN